MLDTSDALCIGEGEELTLEQWNNEKKDLLKCTVYEEFRGLLRMDLFQF